MVHVEPALVEVLEFDPEEVALYELLLLAQLRPPSSSGLGGSGGGGVGAGALAHVGVIGDAAGAAVFERLVALDADAGFDEWEEQNPQDPDDEPTMNQSAAFFSSPNHRSNAMNSCVSASTRMLITTYSECMVFMRTGLRASPQAMYLSEQ